MRDNALRGTHGRMNGQFYSLFHRDDAWPKFLIFVIIVFYATIFALFALSYTYIFSGIWGGNGKLPTRLVGNNVNVLQDATLVPKSLATSLDANVLDSIGADTATVPSSPAMKTSVHINGNNISVPANGSVHKNITTGDGNASININTQSNGSTSSDSSSSIDLTVSSSSTTNSEVQQ